MTGPAREGPGRRLPGRRGGEGPGRGDGPDARGPARRLLTWLLPPGRRDDVLGDLDERFARRLDAGRVADARRWYRRQVGALLVWGAGERAGALASGLATALLGALADLRTGARGLAGHPAWALTAVLTLALGIGGTTAVFSVVDGVLLRPLPFAQPGGLVALHETRLGQSWWSAAPSNAVAWRERSRTLDDVAWTQPRSVSWLAPPASAEQVDALAASPNLLSLLGVTPVLGRDLGADDALAGAEPVALLTGEAWARRFGSDPEVVGRRIDLDGVPHTVVGVLPQGRAPTFAGSHEVIVPRVLTEAELRTPARILQSVARLAPGVSLGTAREEMAALAAELDRETVGDTRGWGVRVVPLADQLVGPVRAPLVLLLVAVGFVLLVACVNLGHLMLARGTVRAAELAVRASLGASRGRLVRQLLAESLLLAVLGGGAGLALALRGTNLLLRVDPTVVPRLEAVQADARLLAFTALVSVAAALLFGLVPALRVSRVDLAGALRSGPGRGGGGPGEARLRSGLVATEVALVLVLLVAAGVTARSLGALTAVDPGFRTEDRIAARFTLPASRYPDGASMGRFVADLLERVREVPGVTAAGTVSTLPLTGGAGFTAFHILRSLPLPSPGEEPIGGVEVVSPGYFAVMGIPVLAGRDFTDADARDGREVAIVDRGVQSRPGAAADPLTDAVLLAPPGNAALTGGGWREIVGVVGDVRYGLDADPRPRLYLPEGAAPPFRARTLVVRTAPGADVAGALRAVLAAVDPAVPFASVEPLEVLARRSVARSRLQGLLMAAFGAVGLGLGAVGVYGVVGFTVGRRTRELGLRMALGASRATVVADVLGGALLPVGIGIVVGALLGAAASPLLASLAFGVAAYDPVVLGLAPAVLLVVAVGAALPPALRASRTDPLGSLRAD